MKQNFIEGYSRSKDFLSTLATNMTSVDMPLPWTVKSQGMITSADGRFNNYMHLCMRKELPSGDIINLLFLDIYNRAESPDNYGNLQIWSFLNDGCDVANDIYMHYPGNVYHKTNYVHFNYHGNSVADVDATPQFVWFWMWADNDSFNLTVLGNQGGAGSASSVPSGFSLNCGIPTTKDFIKTPLVYDIYQNEIFLARSYINEYDYDVPSLDKSWVYRNVIANGWIANGNTSASSNPDSYKQKFIVSKIKVNQNGQLTHTMDNSILSCMAGDSATTGLMRGDIVTIDSEKADYVFQDLNYSWQGYYLIKRAESCSDITLVNNANTIDVSVFIPEKCFGVKVVRKLDDEPANIDDGDIVYNDDINGALTTFATLNFNDSTVATGNTYYYKAFAYSENNIISVPVTSATSSITI